MTAARDLWQEAYVEFETPEQEIRKFARRLRSLKVQRWDRSLRILEAMCGRGNGAEALKQMGFRNVTAIDLSRVRARDLRGRHLCVVGDIRDLPFRSMAFDVVVVHGGLHHLTVGAGLDMTLREFSRVLVPSGRLVAVEPWLTPFLELAHSACRIGPVRKLSRRISALARMIEHERATYESWLHSPDLVLATIADHFRHAVLEVSWGKLKLVGLRRDQA